MSARPPPRYAVHPVNAPPKRSRRWLWWALAWLLSLAIVAVLAIYLTRQADHAPVPPGTPQSANQLAADNADLKQQLAVVQRSQQVANVATKKLTDNLAERDQKISGLRADLAFYSRLVGGGAKHSGLQLQSAHVTPVSGSRALNVTLTLTHNVKRGSSEIKGKTRIDIDGVRNGQLTRLHWKDITSADQAKGLDFKFKYFQQLHGSMMLPRGFTPNRLRITIDPAKGKAMTEAMPWAQVLKNSENDDHVEQ